MTPTVTPESFAAEPKAESSTFYVTGGTLGADAPSYVERQADHDLLAGLMAGEFCYVLNSRQMGKSSLCVRTMARLREIGWRTCFLDLTKFGGKNLSAEQWYAALLSEAGRELGLRAEMLAFWKANTDLGPMQRLFGAIQQVALPAAESPLAIFVDEIDVTRGLPFSADEFFAGVRQCYVGRATDSELNRLTICLLGTATPADLIQDTRTSPFNIGRRVEVRDFTPEEAAPLAQGLGANGTVLLSRVLHWTGGHPYLTQRLCRAAHESDAKTPGDIDKLCSGLFLTRTAAEADDNLAFVRNRLLKSGVDLAGLLDLYGQMRRGRRVPDDEADPLCAVLKLSGVARTDGGTLHVRNRIYEHVFSKEWIVEHTPGAELRRQREAYRRGMLRTGAVAACVVLAMALLALSAFRNARIANVNASKWKAAQAASDQNLYVADMNLTQQAWEGGNFKHAIALLKETRSLPERGFEWGYWNRLYHPRATVLNAHPAAGENLCYVSADARRLVTIGQDGTARVRDARTGHELLTLRGYSEDADFLPGGSRLLIFRKDGTAQVRDARTGRELYTLQGQAKSTNIVAFSADGSRIAIADGNAARVWDAQNGRLLLTLKGPTNGTVHAIALSPNGKRIVIEGGNVIVSSDGESHFVESAKVWDTTDGRLLLTLQQSDYSWSAAAFSPDGTRIVMGGWNGEIQTWDAQDGRELLARIGDGTAQIQVVAFSPDGKRIVTGGSNGVVRVRNAADGREMLTLVGHTGQVWLATFSADGRHIITFSSDNTVRIWDAQGSDGSLTINTHSSAVYKARFSPDGRRIVTASADGAAKVWDAQTGREMLTLTITRHRDDIVSAAFSPDGRRIVTTSWRDKTTRVWDAQTGHELLTLRGRSAAFSPDGRRIVTAGMVGPAHVWDAQTGRRLLILGRPTDRINTALFSPDGTRIVTTGGWDITARGWDKTARVWDARNGRPLLTLKGHTGYVRSAAFSPDGKRIVTNSLDGTARVWDGATGRLLLTLQGPEGAVYSAAFSPDGKRIVTASNANTAIVWDAQMGAELLTLKGHTAPVLFAAFSPDGSRIVTASEDGTVKVWETDFKDYP